MTMEPPPQGSKMLALILGPKSGIKIKIKKTFMGFQGVFQIVFPLKLDPSPIYERGRPIARPRVYYLKDLQ